MAQIERLEGSGQVRLDLQDGRNLLFESVALPDGCRMLTYADITPLAEAVAAAESANRAQAAFLSGRRPEPRQPLHARSEERRVGKERGSPCRSQWSPKNNTTKTTK